MCGNGKHKIATSVMECRAEDSRDLETGTGPAIRSRHLYLSAFRHLRGHVNQEPTVLIAHA
jgi:hypothetical protein